MSGVSGAGKSTWIKTYQEKDPDAKVFSADAFFMKAGLYQFNPQLLGQAHDECMRKFTLECVKGHTLYWDDQEELAPTLLVDNTNTTVEEICPYYRVAKSLNYSVELVTLLVDPRLGAVRNQHSVPETSIMQMNKRLQDRVIPRYWELTQTTLMWNSNTQQFDKK